MQISRFLGKISSWFFVRLACFVLLISIARNASGRLRGALWLLAFLTAAWAYVALRREARTALDYIVPKIRAWASALEGSQRFQAARKIIGLVCIGSIIATALVLAWPTWSFKASSSLRQDEIMSIVRYSSRGFVPAISTYNLARNHALQRRQLADSRREVHLPIRRDWFFLAVLARWLSDRQSATRG